MVAQARHNYDSKGIHSGLEVGEVFADLENKFISNRKTIFLKALKTNNFKAAVYGQLKEYEQANIEAENEALSKVMRLANSELKVSHEAGTKSVDRAIEALEKQGFKANEVSKSGKGYGYPVVLAGAFSAFRSITKYAKQSAITQIIGIAAAVATNAVNMEAEVDKAQANYLHKGIAGAASNSGVETEMSAQSEFIMRNSSHKALLTAEGERANEYGIHLVIVSAHPSSCPLCSPWQGKVLVDDVFSGGMPDGKHELLSTALAAGLGHWNCRHNWLPFVEGLDNPNLFNHDKASPEETAKRYAIEQQQRNNERMIREWKRREAGSLSEVGQKQAQMKIAEWQGKQRALRDIADRHGVPFYRQYSREQVGGGTKPTIKAEVAEYLESLTIDEKADNIKISGATTYNEQIKEDFVASRMYDNIRKSDKDIAKISKNTGIEKHTVQEIKNHLYYKKHDIYGVKRRFDPSYEQAISWKRLESGKNIQDKDLVFLKHEIAEMDYIKQGFSRENAHKLATEKYNFKKIVDERGDVKW